MKTIDADIFIGLLHHPIYNKLGDKITTTITNYDLHDISRAARTYDINKYYVINHLKSQQDLVKRMKGYWTGGRGANYCYNRHEAFSVLEIASTLDEVKENIKNKTGKDAVLIATDAKNFENSVSYSKMREIFAEDDRPFLIILGTGYGLTEETLEQCDYILDPVIGRGDFNHLSVRSAASIILDRLLASPWWTK